MNGNINAIPFLLSLFVVINKTIWIMNTRFLFSDSCTQKYVNTNMNAALLISFFISLLRQLKHSILHTRSRQTRIHKNTNINTNGYCLLFVCVLSRCDWFLGSWGYSWKKIYKVINWNTNAWINVNTWWRGKAKGYIWFHDIKKNE